MRPKRIISRSGSLVLLEDKEGKFWLTRRRKLKHDSRRRKNNRACRVVHIPIRRVLKTELGIFKFKKDEKS
jgi:hypothetical protein